MGFRRPEVQILSPRPRWSRVCIACSDFLQRSACAHRAAALSSPGRPAERPPRPAARGRLSCSAFSSFSFVKASREEVGGGPILSLPFPFDPLSRKRTENGREPGPDAREGRRRDRRAGAQAGIRSRFPLIPSQEKELKTGGSRGRARARAGGETGGRAGGGGAGGGAQGMQKSRAEKAARLLCRMECRYRTPKRVPARQATRARRRPGTRRNQAMGTSRPWTSRRGSSSWLYVEQVESVRMGYCVVTEKPGDQ
jgi:hypothetical protein